MANMASDLRQSGESTESLTRLLDLVSISESAIVEPTTPEGYESTLDSGSDTSTSSWSIGKPYLSSVYGYADATSLVTGEALDAGYVDVDELEPSAISTSTPTRLPDRPTPDASWNELFQALLEIPADSTFRNEQLGQLSAAFGAEVSRVARIIVEEARLPVGASRTIAPCRALGGVAGGEKYLHNGVFYKFAVDSHGLYGGDDELAGKAAACELVALMEIASVRKSSVHFPLMCLVDIYGFRIVAATALPISRRTLCAGSADGAATVLHDDEVARILEPMCARLRLAPHLVRQFCDGSLVRVCGPVDMEVHRVGERLFVLDTARLMPPVSPSEVRNHIEAQRLEYADDPSRRLAVASDLAAEARDDYDAYDTRRRAHLWQRMRPEHLKTQPVDAPLSSDALSGFGRHDPKRDEHHERIRRSTERLLTSGLGRFASDLAKNGVPAVRVDRSGGGAASKFLAQLPSALHRRGINVRFLGLLRSRVEFRSSNLRALLLVEMLSRTLKSLVRRRLRKCVLSSHADAAAQVVDLLNSVLVHNTPETLASVWSLCVEKFVGALTVAETQVGLPTLLDVAARGVVLARTTDLCGLRLANGAVARVELRANDVLEIRPRLKTMSFVASGQAMTHLTHARQNTGSGNCDTLLHSAIHSFEAASATRPGDFRSQLGWGEALMELARLTVFPFDDRKLESAKVHLVSALEAEPRCARARLRVAECLVRQAKEYVRRRPNVCVELLDAAHEQCDRIEALESQFADTPIARLDLGEKLHLAWIRSSLLSTRALAASSNVEALRLVREARQRCVSAASSLGGDSDGDQTKGGVGESKSCLCALFRRWGDTCVEETLIRANDSAERASPGDTTAIALLDEAIDAFTYGMRVSPRSIDLAHSLATTLISRASVEATAGGDIETRAASVFARWMSLRGASPLDRLVDRLTFTIGHRCNLLDVHRACPFSFELFLVASKDKRHSLAMIDSVTFDLHETFDPPLIQLTRPPFVVRRNCWGSFSVEVSIRLVPGFVRGAPLLLRAQYPLELRQGIHERDVTFVFGSNNECTRDKKST